MILIVDSWAWLSILENMPVSDQILSHLENPQNRFYITYLTIYETYYRAKKMNGETDARNFIETIKQKAQILEINSDLAILAGEVHMNEKLGLADAFVYAAALSLGGSVLTGDPHFKNKKNVIFIG